MTTPGNLEQAFTEQYPELADTGVSYSIRLSTLQVNSTKAGNFVLQAAMLYGAVVLMVICLTVLSLQQLLDAGQYRYRFSVLRKLGVEEGRIGRLVLRQLGVWFGLPIAVAILVSMVVIVYFLQTVSAEITAYIGFGTLMAQIAVTTGILVLLLICYFLSTWLLFKKAIGTAPGREGASRMKVGGRLDEAGRLLRMLLSSQPIEPIIGDRIGASRNR